MSDKLIRLFRWKLNIDYFKINIFELPYPYKLKNRIIQKDFELNDINIAYATARTICSYNLDEKELYFDVISTFLSHLNLITKNKKGYLQLKKSRLDRLRDFSKTTRTGELAQGINYLFAQQRLGFPYIVDYHLYKSKVGSTSVKKGKSPDFVILSRNSELGLLESKGSASKTRRISGKYGMFQTALRQLRSATSKGVKTLIPSCVWFISDASINNSELYYTKEIIEKKINTVNNLTLIRLHYASWFYLVGDFVRVNSLIENTAIETLENDESYTLGTDEGTREVYWLNRGFNIADSLRIRFHFDQRSNKKSRFNIGIYKDVADNLTRREASFETNYETNIDGEFQKFADGTIIRFKLD